MKIIAEFPVTVRRDLDLAEAVSVHGMTLRLNFSEHVLDSFGGHVYLFPHERLRASEVRWRKTEGIDRITCDYTASIDEYGAPRCGLIDHECVSGVARGVLVAVEEQWQPRTAGIWLRDQGLQPASMYEHLAVAQEAKDEFLLVPFAGYANPIICFYTGLITVQRRVLAYSQDGYGIIGDTKAVLTAVRKELC